MTQPAIWGCCAEASSAQKAVATEQAMVEEEAMVEENRTDAKPAATVVAYTSDVTEAARAVECTSGVRAVETEEANTWDAMVLA